MDTPRLPRSSAPGLRHPATQYCRRTGGDRTAVQMTRRDFLKILFVRNPFPRILSTYMDKHMKGDSRNESATSISGRAKYSFVSVGRRACAAACGQPCRAPVAASVGAVCTALLSGCIQVPGQLAALPQKNLIPCPKEPRQGTLYPMILPCAPTQPLPCIDQNSSSRSCPASFLLLGRKCSGKTLRTCLRFTTSRSCRGASPSRSTPL